MKIAHSQSTESDPNEDLRQLRKSTLSGTIGTALEYYDFVLYGLAAAFVFNKLFFPETDPAVGLLASFATYAVGFLARPIGGIVLGALGDRLGRKSVLVITVLLMGLSSFGIGLLPTYETIGLAAPLLLVLLRIMQGFGAGAELASASTLMVESAPRRRRGLVGSLVCIGTNTGTLVASGIWLLVSLLPDDQLFSWGWRAPFLVSILVAAWGLWMRRDLSEGHAFHEVADRQKALSFKTVYRDLVRNGWRAFLLCFGMRLGEAGTSILYQVFLVGYLSTMLGVDRSTGTLALVLASVYAYLSIPLLGHLSDRYGRRIVFRALSGFQLVFAVPGIMMIQSGRPVLIILAFVLAFGTAVLGMYAVESSYMPEMFGSRYRLAGLTAAKEIGGLLGGGIAPMIAAALTAATGSLWPIGCYIALLAGVAFVCAIAAPETKGRDLVSEHDAGREARA
ncbi:MFS transporter [Saccharopolyspora hattusasensis]|uniref:MFS transporter n=1 Tax=Saccharopolyspora hattusasensis TaxID=1128679 RepID=UPI003D97B65B